MLLVTVLVFITLSLKGGMYVFYVKYYLDPVAQTIFLNDIGFTAFIDHLNSSLTSMGFVSFQWPKDAPTSAFSLFNAGGIIFMIFGIMFSKLLADSFGKRNIYITFIFLSALSLLLFNFYNRTAIALVFMTQLLHGFIYGITIPLLWTMIADVADYSEWTNNRRATATVFSVMKPEGIIHQEAGIVSLALFLVRLTIQEIEIAFWVMPRALRTYRVMIIIL